MTTNQLSFQANQETARHNAAMEELNARANQETQRHNEQVEGLEQIKLAYEKEYREAYLRWQKADAAEKNRLQSQMNSINSAKNDIQREIAMQDYILQSELNEITRLRDNATKEHNAKLATHYQNQLEWEKQSFYYGQIHRYHELAVKTGELKVQSIEAEIRRQELEANKKVKKTESFKNITQGIQNIGNTLTNLGTAISQQLFILGLGGQK